MGPIKFEEITPGHKFTTEINTGNCNILLKMRPLLFNGIMYNAIDSRGYHRHIDANAECIDFGHFLKTVLR